MKKWNRFKEAFVSSAEIPRDLAYQEPIITVYGQHYAVIENYRQILRYTDEEIVVQTIKGKISICGKRLKIPCYRVQEMEISGRIFAISVDRK